MTRSTSRRARRLEVNPVAAGELALPHEHDQVPEERNDVRTQPQPGVAQAHRDLESGLVDTDNYTRVYDVVRPTLARRRRSG